MSDQIKIQGARVHNLKNISITLPKFELIVITGLSGSGKSSLAFDTIYAEGQRRYVESLSAYARQFLDQLDKPDVDVIEGLSPAISIDQKSSGHNPRSTVGTVTEIYDYLRLLYACIGIPHCPNCGRPVKKQSPQEILEVLLKRKPKKKADTDSKITVLSPLINGQKGEHVALLEGLKKQGFTRVVVDGSMYRLDEPFALDKNKTHKIDLVVDRLTLSKENQGRVFESIETALKTSKGLVLIEQDGVQELFSEQFACPNCTVSIAEVSPRTFSFNSPYGACQACNGLGDRLDFDIDLILDSRDMPIVKASSHCLNLDGTYYGRHAQATAKRFGFSLTQTFNELSEAQQNILLYGDEVPLVTPTLEELIRRQHSRKTWEGIVNNLRRRYLQTPSEMMRQSFARFMREVPCHVCEGARLNQAAIGVRIREKNIAQLCAMPIEELFHFFDTLKLGPTEEKIAAQVLKELKNRSGFLVNVGLNYLSLSRKSNTLSGGEFQRIRLATQIGSGLTGVLYVLDEPSIGLHQRDNDRLIQTLKQLQTLGNTLIVVEHDEEMIRSADFVVDIGPGAGRHGGEVVFAGPFSELKKAKNSLTADYLFGRQSIEVPKVRRKPKAEALVIKGARENNLKNVTVTFPLGQLIGITGVSGSGKSTLIHEILYKELASKLNQARVRPGAFDKMTGIEFIDKIIVIDQSPIGRTPRSNPATYTQVFGPIRDLFAMTRDAKIRGYRPGRFSFNVKGGRCEACEGDGLVKIEMHFLSDVFVTCEVCKGKRFNDETLSVLYKGHSISDILELTVDQAVEVFAPIPAIASKLKTLQEVGLGYVKLGQNATTLSGGEAQRIKLSRELSKRATGKTLYLLDEPTTGLHFEDVRKLLSVLNKLVDTGNTVIVIEHNLDMIKTADYLIDLGPSGGHQGGRVVATGTPEEVAKVAESATGHYLKPLLKRSLK